MTYLSLFTGIFTLAVGLFGLVTLLWQRVGKGQNNKITLTDIGGRGSLCLALVLIGINNLLQYYNLEDRAISSLLSFVAMFCSITTLLLLLRSRKNSPNNKA